MKCGLLRWLPLLLVCLGATRAQAGAGLLAPAVLVSQDSEGFSVRKTGAGLAPLYAHGGDHTLLKVARHHYAMAGWSADSTQFSVARTALDTRSGLGYQASLGLNARGSHQLLTADLDASHAWGEGTQGGLFLSRDWVETRNALTQGVYQTFYGGSLEQRLAPGWVGIGLLGQQHFSDGNLRQHVRLRLIHDLLPELGVNAQYRHRHFWNSQSGSGNYFSPQVYAEDMLALGWRRRLQGWMLAGTLGVGQQRVASEAATATHLAEAEVSSPLAGRVFLKMRVGHSDSASLGGPNYRYRYLQGDLMFAF